MNECFYYETSLKDAEVTITYYTNHNFDDRPLWIEMLDSDDWSRVNKIQLDLASAKELRDYLNRYIKDE